MEIIIITGDKVRTEQCFHELISQFEESGYELDLSSVSTYREYIIFGDYVKKGSIKKKS